MLKPSLLLLFGALFSFSSLAQSDTSKPAVCKNIYADSRYIHAYTKGAMTIDPDLGIHYFTDHESDSLFGFIETTDFRQVIFMQTPESKVIIYGLGNDFKVKGEFEEIEVQGLKESIAIHKPITGEFIIYRPIPISVE